MLGIIAFVLFILIIGFIIYFLVFKDKLKDKEEGNEEVNETGRALGRRGRLHVGDDSDDEEVKGDDDIPENISKKELAKLLKKREKENRKRAMEELRDHLSYCIYLFP